MTRDRRAATVVFGQSAALLAFAAAVFLFLNYDAADGSCRPDENATDALLAASVVEFTGLVVFLLTLLRAELRGARTAALRGRATSLLPAVLLLALARHYVASITPGCPL